MRAFLVRMKSFTDGGRCRRAVKTVGQLGLPGNPGQKFTPNRRSKWIFFAPGENKPRFDAMRRGRGWRVVTGVFELQGRKSVKLSSFRLE